MDLRYKEHPGPRNKIADALEEVKKKMEIEAKQTAMHTILY